eukprot:467288-Pleurochrysis_carterae.AAC.1
MNWPSFSRNLMRDSWKSTAHTKQTEASTEKGAVRLLACITCARVRRYADDAAVVARPHQRLCNCCVSLIGPDALSGQGASCAKPRASPQSLKAARTESSSTFHERLPSHQRDEAHVSKYRRAGKLVFRRGVERASTAGRKTHTLVEQAALQVERGCRMLRAQTPSWACARRVGVRRRARGVWRQRRALACVLAMA